MDRAWLWRVASVLLVAHSSHVARAAQRVVQLEGGRLLAEGR